MAKLAPFNITMINPDEYVKRKQCLPVSSNAMYESSTERFHPDGLYSRSYIWAVRIERTSNTTWLYVS